MEAQDSRTKLQDLLEMISVLKRLTLKLTELTSQFGLRKKYCLSLKNDMPPRDKSLDPSYRDYIELNDLNVPLELRRYQVDDLMPTIKEVVGYMDGYRDQDMGDVIFGEPFCKALCVETKRFKHLSNAQCSKIKPLLKDLAGKEINKVGEVSIIWNPMCVVVMLSKIPLEKPVEAILPDNTNYLFRYTFTPYHSVLV
uniref:Uncharacterized protein n=1 Tax=Tanacetum cinerariifolium TaxID=118510 RepID=A0A6L2L9J0_TANCI|nr:hypothetical protein [Tanacetum cinerariifolium]